MIKSRRTRGTGNVACIEKKCTILVGQPEGRTLERPRHGWRVKLTSIIEE